MPDIINIILSVISLTSINGATNFMQESPDNRKYGGPYLDEYMPYSFFCKVVLLFFQRVKMLSQWHSLYELHDYVQLVICIKENESIDYIYREGI